MQIEAVLISLLVLFFTPLPFQQASVPRTSRSTPKVNFTSDHASAYDGIVEVAKQTRVPIGIVLGQPVNKLSLEKHSFHIESLEAEIALLEAIRGTKFSLKKEHDVFVLSSGNLTSRQHDLLAHRYKNLPRIGPSSMFELGANLTMWMRADTRPMEGYASSIPGSLDDEKFTLEPTHGATRKRSPIKS